MNPTICLAIAMAIAGLGGSGQPEIEHPPRFEQRWVYAAFNLQVNEQADRLIAVVDRAAAAGYNGLLLADYKLNILDRVPDHYFKNVERVAKAASAANIELIPAVFPIGYSNGLLAHDPNLVEALPAWSTFLVRGNEVVPWRDAKSANYRNGGLEETNADRFAALSFQDDPGNATVADHEVAHSGRISCRMRDTHTTSSGGNSRIVQGVEVLPEHCYRFSAWVKTGNLERHGNFRLLALAEGSGRPLTFFEGGVERTRDWSRVQVVFNSLQSTRVNLYAGLWGGSPGTLWIDDLALEEVSLINVVRRAGCPLIVASEQGAAFEEGRDYLTLADPKLGQVPYAGEYDFDHEPPKIRLTKTSRIKDGEHLRVQWHHPVLIHGNQVTCCLSEPKVYDILRDQARRVNDLLHPKTFFMSHDELRVANWCKACQDRRLAPGALLADNVKRCVAILREISPQAEVYVWSDMFDPHHNAVNDYYLVNGTLAESWQGLPSSVIIANWNSGKAPESLDFFSQRGHRQLIAGYYDADDLSGLSRWVESAKGISGVSGFMYTTWQSKYGLLEAYGQAMNPQTR